MQLYTEAQEYAAPELYWEVLDLLLAMPVEAFTAHSVAWEALDTAIQKAAPLPAPDGLTTPADNPPAAARTLGELYQKRALAQLYQEALRRLRDGEAVSALVRGLEEGLAAVQEAVSATRPGALLWGDALVEHVLELAREAQAAREAGRETLGIPTGHTDLDRVLNGLNLGLYVLGGAPGVGKTSLPSNGPVRPPGSCLSCTSPTKTARPAWP